MEKIDNKSDKPMRAEDLTEAITGEKHRVLNDEQRKMMYLLSEEYSRKGRTLIVEIKKWREENPSATFADAIIALYKKIEEEK